MNDAKQAKIDALNNRTSFNSKCDLRKYSPDGESRRCKNCTKFFHFSALNFNNKCKPCWNEEMSFYRKGKKEEFLLTVHERWDIINKEYLDLGVKKCNTCSQIKPFDGFWKESNTYDGRQNKCISCFTEYNSQSDSYSKEYNKIKSRELYNFKRKNNPQFKLTLNLRNRLKDILKNYLNKGYLVNKESSIKLIGIPIEDFVSYIEERFVIGYMSWENHGKVWELDHILPISSFDLTQEEQLKECFYYTNYQPLFKFTTTIDGVEHIGNRNKSNKII
jgi:hypothetical protein